MAQRIRLAAALLLLGLGRATAAPRLEHRLFVSPDEIRALDTRTLAELIVGRIRAECDLAGDEPASGDKVLGDDPAMVMMVPAAAFDSIAREGFLNQHLTLTSGGSHRERDRFDAEEGLAMLRLPFSFKGRELLPKYAVLDVPRGDLGRFSLPSRYGGVAVVFKQEVAARATWTYADSLDYSRKVGRFAAGGDGNPVLARTFSYERKKEDGNRCGNYCEAQIWGELSLSDVEYLMVRDTEPVPASVGRTGIPVYGYMVAEDPATTLDAGKTAQYVRGALRSEAAPAENPAGEPGEAERNFLREREFLNQSDEALAAMAGNTSDNPRGRGGFSPRQRLIGELAARPKSPAVVRALEDAYASRDDQTRSLALYGLSETPWSVFKPFLLAGLAVAPGPTLISAVAFAADHQDDPDVAAAIERLHRAPGSTASEWVERLTRTRLCAPR